MSVKSVVLEGTHRIQFFTAMGRSLSALHNFKLNISVTLLAFKKVAGWDYIVSQNNLRQSSVQRELTKRTQRRWRVEIDAIFTHHFPSSSQSWTPTNAHSWYTNTLTILWWFPFHTWPRLWKYLAEDDVVTSSWSKLKSTDLPVTVSEGHLGQTLTQPSTYHIKYLCSSWRQGHKFVIYLFAHIKLKGPFCLSLNSAGECGHSKAI